METEPPLKLGDLWPGKSAVSAKQGPLRPFHGDTGAKTSRKTEGLLQNVEITLQRFCATVRQTLTEALP